MIVCDCLHKKFGTVTAVDGVSMEIKDGTFLGLLGPNGAGKTTLMRMMTGLLMPDTGTVMFDGQPIDRNAVAVKQAIGVTSQHMNLDKELTVEENMEFAGRLYRMGKADIAASTDRLSYPSWAWNPCAGRWRGCRRQAQADDCQSPDT